MKHRNTNTAKPYLSIRSTPFGPVALVWTIFDNRPRISRVLLSRPGLGAKHPVSVLFPDSTVSSCHDIDAVAKNIDAFLNGEDIQFSLELVCMNRCSEFQQEVLRAEHGIPRGTVSTYQRIARHLGNPKGARAVGNALANNPFPIIIPCHRAIRSDRSPGGYQGGLEMKRTLLKMEGLHFDDTGRVVIKDIFY